MFPIILERLRGTIARLKLMIKDIPDEKLCAKKNDKWSIKEIIGHLNDLEELWNGRIDDFLSKKEILRAADMSNKKTHEADHNDKYCEKLLKQFMESRLRLINRVRDLTETEVAMTALHPRLQTPMRLIDSLFFAAEHDDHELTKIRQLLGS